MKYFYLTPTLAALRKCSFCRIITSAVQSFIADQCYLRASALTFYSLLSIVPIFALVFGIAKGFHFDDRLKEIILAQVEGHETIIEQALNFANSLIDQTKGDIIAGVGILLLFWSVIRLLSNVEDACNVIWRYQTGRSWKRKFADYLSLILICPVLLIVSSSVTIFIAAQVEQLATQYQSLQTVSPILLQILLYLPYLLTWGLFSFLFAFIPNTNIKLPSALIGGLFTAISYQTLQWIYIHFQIGAARYGAIYGSFAALPLFLVWLHISWMITLLGAEITFAHQYRDVYHSNKQNQDISHYSKLLCAFSLVMVCVEQFQKGHKALQGIHLSTKLQLPQEFLQPILQQLVEVGLLSTIILDSESQEVGYQPARDLSLLTPQAIIEAIEKQGQFLSKEIETYFATNFEKLNLSLQQAHAQLKQSFLKQPLTEFLE